MQDDPDQHEDGDADHRHQGSRSSSPGRSSARGRPPRPARPDLVGPRQVQGALHEARGGTLQGWPGRLGVEGRRDDERDDIEKDDQRDEVPAARCAACRARASVLPGPPRPFAARSLVTLTPCAPGHGRVSRSPVSLIQLLQEPGDADDSPPPRPERHRPGTRSGRTVGSSGFSGYRCRQQFGTASRSEDKFADLVAFGAALGRLRRRVDRDLRSATLDHDHVVAVVVRLLDLTGLRVGNEEYARENRSFGLTTLRDRHAVVRGSTINLSFTGQVGPRVRRQCRQRAAGAARPPLPEPSGPTTVPVPNGRRWAPRDRFDRRQRLPRRTRQRLDVGQVVSHVERDGARGRGIRAGGR